jgi:hypothetical protein
VPGCLVGELLQAVGLTHMPSRYAWARKGQASLWHRFATAARTERAVLLGGVPAVATMLVLVVFGVSVTTAVDVALWLTVVFLGGIAYLAARRVGTPPRLAFAESIVGALLGVLMIEAKGLLH